MILETSEYARTYCLSPALQYIFVHHMQRAAAPELEETYLAQNMLHANLSRARLQPDSGSPEVHFPGSGCSRDLPTDLRNVNVQSILEH